jgi:hypothetical protein
MLIIGLKMKRLVLVKIVPLDFHLPNEDIIAGMNQIEYFLINFNFSRNCGQLFCAR